jgi:putative serine protease PepD
LHVAEGRPTGAAGAGPAWWSDALNDPWRNPESNAVILSGGESTQPPEPDAGTFRSGGRGIALIASVAAVVGLLAGALGGALGYYAATQQREPAVRLGAGIEAPPPLRTSDSLPELISRVMPSVVTVQGSSGQDTSLGSGFVITQDGYILTNEHVVAEIADGSLRVTLADTTTVAARVVGRDQESDLAVLKIERDNLRPVEFGNSDGVAVGDGVLAIGSPLALPGTVTSGIVSALDRPIQSHEANGVQRYYAAIQTDAAVNRGNSGGPLFDLNGRVIGINSVIKSLVEDGQETGNIGIAFAIPINHAGRVASEIIDTGKARRTVIGAQVEGIRSGGGGARLTTVDAGGPAEAAGLRGGDVVVRIGSHQVDQPHDLIALVRRYDPGTTVTVTYRRGAETQTTSVTLVADAN